MGGGNYHQKSYVIFNAKNPFEFKLETLEVSFIVFIRDLQVAYS